MNENTRKIPLSYNLEQRIETIEERLDRLETQRLVETESRQVYEDCDQYRCGKIHAIVSADVHGTIEAEISRGLGEFISSLKTADLRDLRSLCDVLIRRVENTDQEPIFQAIE